MIENKTIENKKELEIPVDVAREEDRFVSEYEVVSDELLLEVGRRIPEHNIKAFRELAK